MKKSLFGLLILFLLLTTYQPKFNLDTSLSLKIKKIIIENNSILETDEINQKLSFLYNKSLFFLNIGEIEDKLKTLNFIESFSVKKVYPNKLKLYIKEKTPIAVLQKKKKKFYISNKGDLIKFIDIKDYYELPLVFGNGEAFFSLYQDLNNINFPFNSIKSYYYFESGRWDLILQDDRVIKLPIINYSLSLENFMISKKNSNFDNYKIFDYRIKDQLILN